MVNVNGKRIREYREGHGITRDALAEKLGVYPRLVKSWEQGWVELEDHEVQTIASAIDVDRAYFFLPDRENERGVIFFCGSPELADSQCCERECREHPEYLCDWPLNESGATCSRPLCDIHAVVVGGIEDDIDYCPTHGLMYQPATPTTPLASRLPRSVR